MYTKGYGPFSPQEVIYGPKKGLSPLHGKGTNTWKFLLCEVAEVENGNPFSGKAAS